MSEWKPTSIHDAFSYKKPDSKEPYHFWKIYAIIVLIALCLLGYLNAQRNRYHSFADGYLILDTWTGKVYEVDNQIIPPKN